MAQDFENQNLIEAFLSRVSGPVRRVRDFFYIREGTGPKILQDVRDNTDIGQDGGVDTVVGREAHVYTGCQHYAHDNNLGGLCECGLSVCEKCLILCDACGAATCPKHRSPDPEDPRRVFCVVCSDEIARARRIRGVVGVIASFFFEPGAK